jgi:citrate synthase
MGTLVAMWQSIRQRKDFVGPDETMSYAKNFLYMYHGETPNPDHVRIMDTCLTLHAEHTINASTFSAMVAGSTLATPSQVISSAIGTLAGPLHGGANQKVVPMLKEIGSPENARSWMIERMKQKKVVWGMGHREYSVKDPRATILEGMMKKIGIKDAQVFETALALEEVCEEFLAPKGVFPNVDFYSGILYTELGFDSDQFTPLFAISRTAGWLAHWQEQIRQNRIFRPTQIYTGEKLRCI